MHEYKMITRDKNVQGAKVRMFYMLPCIYLYHHESVALVCVHHRNATYQSIIYIPSSMFSN